MRSGHRESGHSGMNFLQGPSRKDLFDYPGMSLLRLFFFRRQARRDSQAASQIAEKLGHANLDWRKNEIFKKTDRDVLYILGSGSSINDLTESNFETISRGSSVGINVWAIHPFVPDVYSFESASQMDGVVGEVEFLEHCLTRPEVLEKRPGVLLLRQRVAPGETQIIRFPSELLKDVHVYGRVNVVSHEKGNLAKDIELGLKSIRGGRVPGNVLLDNGASVVRLVVLGLLQGFREIVLVGVDLDRRPYFWLADNYAHPDPEVERLFPRRSGVPHDTLETESRPFAVDEVIVALARISRDSGGVKVMAGSADSTLASRLGVHDWG